MLDTEKPRAKAGSGICPFHRKDMSKVCHTCPLWVHVRGKHPQSTEIVDMWNCSFALMPMLTIETTQMSRQTGAAVESLRNVVATRAAEPVMHIALAPQQPTLEIENGHGDR